MANWANIQMLQQRGVELVSRLNQAHRTADFRRGRRLGPGDHIVRWAKPTSIRSLDRAAYLMAQAAAKHDLLPRSISFTGTLQTLVAFQPLREL